MFCREVDFLQKVVVFHPTNPDKFLAIHRSANDTTRPNDWDLVGGHVSFGENNEESLRREAKEEAGIRIQNLIPVQVTTIYHQEKKIYKLFIGYIGFAQTEIIRLSHEHDAYLWVSSKEFNKLTSTQFLLDLVLAATKKVI